MPPHDRARPVHATDPAAETDLHCYWRTPAQVKALLEEAGLEPTATVTREPEGETSRPRARVLAREPD